ncbi:MAG: VOC family protein [Nocardioidaceae bacterium]|nr:VOC family protein [Nocardioidaceae bacterium]MDQ3165434.1 VOC family protein [Actinomycetota bacterium]
MGHTLNVVTLGVRDKERARAFYDTLGWRGRGGTADDPVFYHSRGMVVALWDRASLATDSCVQDDGGWGGVTFAYNVGSEAEVDAITEAARGAGGTVAREPSATFWGGYSAMVHDPDGHPWEIAHNPHWGTTGDGGVVVDTRAG